MIADESGETSWYRTKPQFLHYRHSSEQLLSSAGNYYSRSIFGEFRVPPSVLTLSEMLTAEPETYGTRGSTVPLYPSSFYILVRRREVSSPSAVYSLALSSGWCRYKYDSHEGCVNRR